MFPFHYLLGTEPNSIELFYVRVEGENPLEESALHLKRPVQVAPLPTNRTGVLITGLGIIGYFATGQVSKTALIPCVFGLPIIALAIVSWLKPYVTKQTLVAALVIALLAFGGTVRGVSGLVILTGGEVARTAAVIFQAIMAIASLVYILILGIYLFKKTPNKN